MTTSPCSGRHCSDPSIDPERPSKGVVPRPRRTRPRTACRSKSPSRSNNGLRTIFRLSDPARGWACLAPDPPTNNFKFQILDFRSKSQGLRDLHPQSKICSLKSPQTLNHGVIHTYLICHKSRRAIFKGKATMVSSRNCMMENCSRLMRWKSFPIFRRNREYTKPPPSR